MRKERASILGQPPRKTSESSCATVFSRVAVETKQPKIRILLSPRSFSVLLVSTGKRDKFVTALFCR